MEIKGNLILKLGVAVSFRTPVTTPFLHGTSIKAKPQCQLSIIKTVELLKKAAIWHFEVLDLDLRVG
jgi:hypothetical protein